MKKVLFILVVVITASCSTKKKVVKGKSNTAYLTTKQIIDRHYKNTFTGSTMSAKIHATFNDGRTNIGANVSLRMEKGKTIWMSVSKLGFTIAKLKVTPTNVQYYEKWQGVYFDGDFSLIAHKLGVPLTFEQLENVLLGQSVKKLRPKEYTLNVQDDAYKLQPEQLNEMLRFLFLVNATHFKMKQQHISYPEKQQNLVVDYKNYQTIGKETVPKNVIIKATEINKQTVISLSYKQVEIGTPLRFPFKIPAGYKKIKL